MKTIKELNITKERIEHFGVIKKGSVVVVSNPHPDSFAYRGTLGHVLSARNGEVTIKSDNGDITTWRENELLYLHD